ncbi:dipeptidyl carboxypeptidase II [Flavobacteriaceae bacterium Ap0902]|nr:dipeptidyl carboxypeptidase II [Flavobacteriaceae bacterium Ap0902]
MRKIIISASLLGLMMSCNTPKTMVKNESTTTQQLPQTDNTLLVESKLPYGAPDFKQIKDEDYLPAMREAMRLQTTRVNEIAAQSEEPTFENTVLALEKSGKEMDQVGNVFYAMTSAHTNDVLKDAQEKLAPLSSEHYDNIYLNDALFKRVKTVYENRNQLQGEDLKLTEEYYKSFIQAGANLTEAQKTELKAMNSQLAELQTSFNQTLLKANNASKIIIKDKSKLKGLSENEMEALKNEDGTYTISILNTTQQPLLSSLENRELRQQIFETSWNRTNGGAHNTNDLIVRIAQLRAQKAALLGFDNYAQWSLVNTMVKTPETVNEFFAGMIPATREKGAAEAADIVAMMEKDGIKGDLQPWDWSYYAEKVRKAKYDLDESQIKPYFEINRVLEDGVFYAATKLYGITFKERKDIPTYHPDVVVYEVFDKDGSPLALFYGDYFARESKRGGAWMSNFVTQSHLYDTKPVIYNVCNYQKPAAGQPALISYDDVETMFHEFGHALHGLFADQKYPTLSGTAVARDFVEYPSQANEHWALEQEVLSNYARHYKTGETIPQELIRKIKNASTFNQGFSLTEVMGAADLDMNWHDKSVAEANQISDPNAFEKSALTKDNLWDAHIPPRYRSSYFAHIFGGGYAAGYYSYLWTEMLAADTGAWFDENGGLKRELGDRYREMILSKGNTMDYKEMYKAFRGEDPSPEHMIQARGLK